MSQDQKQICAYCNSFASKPLVLGGHLRQCRKNAPTHAGWPEVAIDDWCGEFTERRADHESGDTFEPLGDVASGILSKMKIEGEA